MDESQSSDSEQSYDSDDSEYNYIPGVFEYEEEIPNDEAQVEHYEPYSNEPLADEEWLVDYKKQKAIEEELEKKLTQRLDGVDHVQNW